MNSATITFSNNTQIIVTEETTFIGMRSIKNDTTVFETIEKDNLEKYIFPTLSTSIQGINLYNDFHDALIPAILDVFLNFDFFSLENSRNIVYSTSSVVSIESNSN